MIFDRIAINNAPTTMLRCSSSSPLARAISPAGSEISVGSPSPPPPVTTNDSIRLRDLRNIRKTSIRGRTPEADDDASERRQFSPQALPPRRKSSAERVKSFSIADILGRNESKVVSPPQASSQETSIDDQRQQRLLLDGPAATAAAAAAAAAAAYTNVVRPWDPVRGPIPIRPFFPPVLLQYDQQRLALDYQRHLQDHFNAQAQLLRQMSMDPTIIPSEDGSERSRSSSAASDCCSPEIGCGPARSAPDSKKMMNDNNAAAACCSTNGGDSGDTGPSASKSSMNNDTPLNALFQLSTKNFDDEQDSSHLNLFATRPNPKKKRKSRTAFTNHQIFQLEKRFLYQKYLSPANRDEIAAELGLSNAQVITWFQNRRAKLKRDMEELKKDVESVKTLSAYKSFLENVNDLSILKKRPVSQQQHQHHSAASSCDDDEHFESESPPTTNSALYRGRLVGDISNNESSSNSGSIRG